MEFFIKKAYAIDIPGINPIDPNDPNTGFTDIVGRVLTWIFVLAGILAVVYLIYSGIQYITAGGDTEKATAARTGIIHAVIGIVIILLAVLIVTWVMGIVQSGTAG